MVTPLYIEIALHYVCSTGEFSRKDAPACKEAIDSLREAGLLRWNDFDQQHEATEGLRVWVNALTRVPLPVIQWAIPLSSGTVN
jgi:hypothetical protein